MNSIIISPYVSPFVVDGKEEADFGPLLFTVLGGVDSRDITGRINSKDEGLPSVNLCVYEANLTGAQLAQIKSDDRFFVLLPGPGKKGSALTNWLASKGAAGHGVTTDDDEQSAVRKLRGYCRSL